MQKRDNPLVSIITVCLNSEKTIEQTINSVLGQSYKEIEYIIVDGKSTDGTLEIINNYKTQIAKIVSEPDDGLYYAMNKGISMATGDIIGIINSDDWYEKDIVQEVVRKFQEENAELLYGKTNLIDKNQIFAVQIPCELEKLHFQCVFMHASVFVKKEIYEKYGGFNTKYCTAADCDFLLRLYVNNVRFINLNRIVANYRIDGLSFQRKDLSFKEFMEIKYIYLDKLPKEQRKEIEEILVFQKQEYIFACNLERARFEFGKWKPILRSKKIVIFGAGKWGSKLCEQLIKINIIPECFIDNNQNKWKMYQSGIRIENSTYLRNFQGIVLVVVREKSEEIIKEISEMANENIVCISWKELVDLSELK